MCTDDEPAFDIEDVSTLEDASGSQFGWFGDGVMLDVPDYSSLPDGAVESGQCGCIVGGSGQSV